jgi:hypothetical protein
MFTVWFDVIAQGEDLSRLRVNVVRVPAGYRAMADRQALKVLVAS